LKDIKPILILENVDCLLISHWSELLVDVFQINVYHHVLQPVDIRWILPGQLPSVWLVEIVLIKDILAQFVEHQLIVPYVSTQVYLIDSVHGLARYKIIGFGARIGKDFAYRGVESQFILQIPISSELFHDS